MKENGLESRALKAERTVESTKVCNDSWTAVVRERLEQAECRAPRSESVLAIVFRKLKTAQLV